MTVNKPTLPASVFDALVAAESPLAAQYNRANEAEPPAAVVVVVNVNLNYEMDGVSTEQDDRGNWRRVGRTPAKPERIASVANHTRTAVTRALRGDLA